VVKLSRRSRFPAKALQRCLIGSEMRMENLDGDRMVHMDMSRAVNPAHSTFAYLFFYAVLVIEDGPDEFIVVGLQHQRESVEWAEMQLVLELSLAGGALLHRPNSNAEDRSFGGAHPMMDLRLCQSRRNPIEKKPYE
jgi:hypothetical protein